MRGRPLRVDWQDSVEDLERRFRQEQHPGLRQRWQSLWLLRRGYSEREAARIVGAGERTLHRWLAWYRQGGLVAVQAHRRRRAKGRLSYLTAQQRAALAQRAQGGAFFTIWDAVGWVEEEYGVRYTYWGMRSLFGQLHLRKKVPRPLAVKADLERQEAWKRGA
jgi:transposase